MKRALTLASIVMLSGCTNLGAVRDISARLTSASSDWTDVGAELERSCERERTINPDIKDCVLPAAASNGLAGANAVLGAYFIALMSAATETNFTIRPGLDAVAASMSTIPEFNADQVNAVSGLFGLLTDLGTARLREKTLRDLIERGAPSARTVISGLDDLVVTQTAARLGVERTQLSARFARLINQQKDDTGPDPTLLCAGSTASTFSSTGYLLTLEYCRRLAIVDARIKALGEYSASLKTADAALVELQSSRTRLKGLDLAQRLAVIGSELDRKIAAVRKAFA